MRTSYELFSVSSENKKPKVIENIRKLVSNIFVQIAGKVVKSLENLENKYSISKDFYVPFTNIIFSVVLKIDKQVYSEPKDFESPEYKYFSNAIDLDPIVSREIIIFWNDLNLLFDSSPLENSLELKKLFFSTMKLPSSEENVTILQNIWNELNLNRDNIEFLFNSADDFNELTGILQKSSELIDSGVIPSMFDIFAFEQTIFREKLVDPLKDKASRILYGVLRVNNFGEVCTNEETGFPYINLRGYEIKALKDMAWSYLQQRYYLDQSSKGMENYLQQPIEILFTNPHLGLNPIPLVGRNPKSLIGNTGFSVQ